MGLLVSTKRGIDQAIRLLQPRGARRATKGQRGTTGRQRGSMPRA
jgi:hypothetical protein